MKYLTITFVFMGLFSILKAQDTHLTGTWSIIEFTVTNNDQTNKMNEDALKEKKSVWNMELLKDGVLKQTSNMRNGNLESQEGTWDVAGDHLILSMKFDDRDIKLEYTYELKNDTLVLTRSNPMATMKIESRFRRND